MIQDPILSDSDGWYHLSYLNVDNSWDGSIGSGSSQCYARFKTPEARSSFIKIDKLRDEIGRLNSELTWLKTVKGANRNLRDARERAKKARAEEKAYRKEVGLE